VTTSRKISKVNDDDDDESIINQSINQSINRSIGIFERPVTKLPQGRPQLITVSRVRWGRNLTLVKSKYWDAGRRSTVTEMTTSLTLTDRFDCSRHSESATDYWQFNAWLDDDADDDDDVVQVKTWQSASRARMFSLYLPTASENCAISWSRCSLNVHRIQIHIEQGSQ